MARAASKASNSSKSVQWQWQSNRNPWSNSKPTEWKSYSDAENEIIEDAFCNEKRGVMLERCQIDFIYRVQISNNKKKNKRRIKRVFNERTLHRSVGESFKFDPIAPKLPFGGQYGWVSPFITEVRSALSLKPEQLPSKDKHIVPMLVEKAAQGIIEEGKLINQENVAQQLAKFLLAEKKTEEPGGYGNAVFTFIHWSVFFIKK